MLRISQPTFLGREEKYVSDAVTQRALSMGKYVLRLEELLAEAHEAGFCRVTSSGTAALHLSLLALGVKPGDRVIVPACSYIATANAVRYCGATPVFVDVHPDTWCLDEGMAEEAIEHHKAKFVIPVHLYGARAGVPMIRGVGTLEDSCEAHGVPLSGDAAVLSFYGNKIITCGEGGAVLTHQAGVAERVALLRGQGTTGRQRYVHEELGYNYRMTDLQAAVGVGQVEVLPSHIRMRHKLRVVYDSHLPKNVGRQVRVNGSVDWVMPVLVEKRDRVAERLHSNGIETRPVFPPLHQQPQYATGQFLPHAERIARDGLLLPLHLGMGEAEVKMVCSALQEAVGEAAA